jgi:hypothetical protein
MPAARSSTVPQPTHPVYHSPLQPQPRVPRSVRLVALWPCSLLLVVVKYQYQEVNRTQPVYLLLFPVVPFGRWCGRIET